MLSLNRESVFNGDGFFRNRIGGSIGVLIGTTQVFYVKFCGQSLSPSVAAACHHEPLAYNEIFDAVEV